MFRRRAGRVKKAAGPAPVIGAGPAAIRLGGAIVFARNGRKGCGSGGFRLAKSFKAELYNSGCRKISKHTRESTVAEW